MKVKEGNAIPDNNDNGKITAETVNNIDNKKVPQKRVTKKKENLKNKTPEVKEQNPLIKKVSISVSKEDIEANFTRVAKNYLSQIKLPGFRRGKVPFELIKSRYKEQIEGEVIKDVTESAIFKKIDEEKIRIASAPMLEKIDYEAGNDLKADFSLELYPQITLPDLKEIEVEISKESLSIKEFNEKEEIEKLLNANKERIPLKNGEIKDGNVIIYNYQSRDLKTNKLSKRERKTFTVSADSGSDIKDLYKQVLGKRKGDNISVMVSYPDIYSRKAWAGKKIEHKISIESIFELKKPEFNKDFVKTLGFTDEKVLLKKIKEQSDMAEKNHLEDNKMKKIIDTLCESINFPVPASFLKREMENSSFQQRALLENMREREKKREIEPLEKKAEKSVKFMLILEAVKELHKFEITREEKEKEYTLIADRNNLDVSEVRKHFRDKKNNQDFSHSLLNKKAIDYIKECVRIKEV